MFVRNRLSAGHQRAFTLTEISVVLSITGLIFFLTFKNYAYENTTNKLNQGSDILSQISNNVRTYYSGQNTSFSSLNQARPLQPAPLSVSGTNTRTPPLPAPNDFCFYTGLLANQNIFPSSILNAGVADNPWSPAAMSCAGAGIIGSLQVALASTAGASPVLLVVRYTNLSADVCSQIVPKTSLPGTDTGLMLIAVNGTEVGDSAAGTLPIPPGGAVTACNNPVYPLNIVDWYYQLGG